MFEPSGIDLGRINENVKVKGSYSRKELVLITFMISWKDGYQLPPTRGEVVPLVFFGIPLKQEEDIDKG